MSSRVVGYVMARDEWPLLGLSITHALASGLDHVVVVDHASTDATQAGLMQLKEAWPDRLTVIRLDADAYLQEATTAVIMAAVRAELYDWVYVFDADEFLLTSNGKDIVTLLNDIPSNVDAVRYEVHQWVATADMDDQDISSYVRITQRAVPCIFIKHPRELLADDIEDGRVNYFDVPFPSKLIVRGSVAHKLSAGAHSLWSADRNFTEQKIDPEQLRVGHLPLLSRRRLTQKCNQGKALIDAGFPRWHGWQNQALREIALADGLDDFWLRHSIPTTGTSTTVRLSANTVADEALSKVLERTIGIFGARNRNRVERLEIERPAEVVNDISFDYLIQVFNTLKTELDAQASGVTQLRVDWETRSKSLNQAVAERDGEVMKLKEEVVSREESIAERDAQVNTLTWAVSEREAQINSLNQAIAEREAQVVRLKEEVARREQLVRVHDDKLKAVTAQFHAVTRSNSWRITSPLREARGWISYPVQLAKRCARSVLRPIKQVVSTTSSTTQGEGKYRRVISRLVSRTLAASGNRESGGKGMGAPESTVSLHDRLFNFWVRNALGQYDQQEHVAIARHAPPSHLSDVKLIAYYLPQFHPIPENNAWWGEGFTEWRNVVRAFPNFEGHYQPRIPGELGFYDLRSVDVMRRQVELAKLYGISAFCFHFYWFGGKTLLELPVRNYLENKDVDLPFCLCWANENWSRRWDGSEHEVLIAQRHSPEDDEAFLRHVERYFRDDRYLKVDGKPVLTVYRPSILPDARATTDRWRRLAEEMGYPGLYLIATNAFAFKKYAELGFDALSEFPPHHVVAPNVQAHFELTTLRTGWRVRLYEDVVASELVRDPGPGRIHPGIMMAWDNSARRPKAGEIIHGSTPALFKQWLRHCFTRARANPDDQQFVFINAWNEWAEGTYLEPDKRFGYAFLNACAEEIRHDTNGIEMQPEIINGGCSFDPAKETVLMCAHHAHTQVFGAERSFLDALRAVSASGRNTVVTLPAHPHPDYMTALLDHASEIRVFPYSQWTHDIESSLSTVPDFISTIRDVRADLVYVNTIVLRAPLDAARLTNTPVVVHVREIIKADEELQNQIGLPGDDIARFIGRHSAYLVANSAATAASFEGVAPIVTVPNIVAVSEFDIAPIGAEQFVYFALISSNLPKKGVEDFVELARRCESTVPEAKFRIIGPLGRPQIRAYQNKSKLAPKNLEFLDYLQTPQEALSRADVVLNMSHFQESFGRTVLEAMAAGRPVIVYDWGALPELVEDRKSGFVVPFRDIDTAAQAVKTLADRTTLARMGAAARERARRISDRAYHDEAIGKVVSQVLSERKAAAAAYSDVVGQRISAVAAHEVDIVICVHNALEDARACLESVERYRNPRHSIVLVDDGSDEETQAFLRSFATERSHVRLHRNSIAQGYTKAANAGARMAKGEFIIFLNSDTIVTSKWAEKLIDGLQSRPGIGMAGPLSNAASYQSIPDVRPTKTQTAVNELPEGLSIDDINQLCESRATLPFPAVPLLHGFCLAMSRDVWSAVGPFDEDAFPRGFGEENDFCLRAADQGFGMVVATNTFVYHAKSKSYDLKVRHKLVEMAQQILYDRHGKKRFLDSVKVLERNPDLRQLRAAARALFDNEGSLSGTEKESTAYQGVVGCR